MVDFLKFGEISSEEYTQESYSDLLVTFNTLLREYTQESSLNQLVNDLNNLSDI